MSPIGTMHHVGIVVRELDTAEAFLTDVFGLAVVDRLSSPAPAMRAVFFACGEGVIELVEFSDPQMVLDRLGDRVAAIDHVALLVDDLDDAVQALGAHGVVTSSPEPLTTPAGRMHFTRAVTSAGVSWQLLEAGTR